MIKLNWPLLAVSASLVGAVTALQTQVNDLKSQAAMMRLRDSAAATRIAKFENDLFATMRAEMNARAQEIARWQAAQNSAARQELQALPRGDFHKTAPYPTEQ